MDMSASAKPLVRDAVHSQDKASGAKAEEMEKEIKALKLAFISRLRELSAMASLRETIAGSLLQVSSNSPNEYCGPGHSPGEMLYSSQNPPHGAEVLAAHPGSMFFSFDESFTEIAGS
jgi:hypothetical protein